MWYILLKALTERAYMLNLCREVAVGASHRGLYVFVASEPGGRKCFA